MLLLQHAALAASQKAICQVAIHRDFTNNADREDLSG